VTLFIYLPCISLQWQGIPGRGEFIRLAFEYTNTLYEEATNNRILLPTITDVSKVGFPPHFAPPCLELPNGKCVSQTPAILDYLALKLGLDGSGSVTAGAEEDVEEEKVLLRAQVNQLVLIALDLNNETHDVHHPIDAGLYYEDQKAEASRRAKSFRASRIPKFFSYFQKVLVNNPKNEGGASEGGPYLITNTTTTADLVLFHMVCGLEFAFPKRMKALKESGNYDLVFKLHERIKAEPLIRKYLNSSRHQTFGNGIFRNYPELDGDE